MPGLGGTTNNYEILAQLASGGMAEIFLARVTAVAGVERHVVLKRILPAFREDPQMVAMFLDEARLQAQLRHPNIAQLHDVGMIGGSYFYTMEYVHGETVQSLMFKALSKREVIPLQHILTIAAGVTAALQHAHTRFGPDRKPLDIIHRDVSPANIMITFDGAVKLLDFGVAKSTGRMTQTRAGVVKGKVAYLSPEQIGEKSIDGRSDLFSLAICMYEMLTLHGLFARPTDLASLAAIVQEMPPPPSTLRRDIPPQIDQLIMTALSKDPLGRFGNADQMHQAVEAAANSTKLSMSPSSLGRYLGQMFGTRPEPWLAAHVAGSMPGEVPVTVIGDIIEPSLARVEQVKDETFERQAMEVDRRISQVRKVVSFDQSDVPTFEDNTTGRRPKMTTDGLPSAAEHPQWEPTMIRSAPLPNDFELDAAETAIASPRYAMPVEAPLQLPVTPPPQRVHRPSQMPLPQQPRAHSPSQAPSPSTHGGSQPSMAVQPRPPQLPGMVPPSPPHGLVPPSGPQGVINPSAMVPPSGPQQRPSIPAMPDGQWPVAIRPSAPLPQQNRGAQQNWEPSTYRTRAAQPKHMEKKSLNWPRIVIALAFLVAIVVAIWIAVT
jgi:serine/threonine protein kinase